MNKQISTIQTREVLELMRNLAPILNQKELFEFMLFSNRVLKRYMPEYYSDGLSEEVMEMRKDKAWLKNEVKSLFDEAYDSGKMEYYESEESIHRINSLVDQLDEPDKPVIPQFVADWIDVLNLHGNNPLREYRDLETDFDEGWTDEEGAEVYHWINKNPYAFIDALRYGFTVEKEKKYRVRAGNRYVRFNLDGSIIGAKKNNSIVCLERLSKLPFDYQKAIESGIITLEEVTE